MSEVARHCPLTQEQQNALKELRESASLEVQLTPVAAYRPNTYVEQHKKREKVVGQNTLRFIVQHTVREQTGLSHWFDLEKFMGLDQLILNKRLRGV